jgi:peptide deformylase
MAKTMYIHQGIGLAAPQVGVDRQVITFDIGEGPVSLINPQILESEGKNLLKEGCLSLPEVIVEVTRKTKLLVRGWDIKKDNEVTIEAGDLLARVVQHEIDHLRGVLIIDKISSLKRQMLINKLKKRR